MSVMKKIQLAITAALVGLTSIGLSKAAKGSPAMHIPASFRDELLAVASAEENLIVEQGGKNRGPQIDQDLQSLGQAPGQNWCAATMWRWLKTAAARVGITLPFEGSAGAKVLGERAAKAGRKVPRHQMSPETVPPGSIIVWDRSPGEPFSSWEGHIGVLKAWTSPTAFTTTEANSGLQGDRVAPMNRTTRDPRLAFAAVLGED